MRSNPADLALRNLERLVAQDPILRDIVNPTLPAARRQAKLVPPVDVVERPDGWMILVELPGVPRASLKVRIDGTRLTVTGEKPPRREGGNARVTERETGTFTREFLLPFQVRGDAISATLDDGLLTIDLPRAGTDGVKEIVVS